MPFSRHLLPAVLPLLMLGGCSAVIDQATFFPQHLPPPETSLTAPAGYVASEAMLALPGLGSVHAVRLDNPGSETAIVYSGGNAASSRRSAPMRGRSPRRRTRT